MKLLFCFLLTAMLLCSACRHTTVWKAPDADLTHTRTLCWDTGPGDANAVAASRLPELLAESRRLAAQQAGARGWMLREAAPADAFLQLQIILRPYAPSSIEARREADAASVGKVGGVTVAPYGRTQVAPDEDPDQDLRECEVVVSLLDPATRKPLWSSKSSRIIDLEPASRAPAPDERRVEVPDAVSKPVLKLVRQVLAPFPPAGAGGE